MEEHSFISPSGVERWGECPASPHMEIFYKDTATDFAKEGATAHALGEIALGGDAYKKVPEDLQPFVNGEMKQHVSGYRDYCENLAKGNRLVGVEFIAPLDDLMEGMKGTADFFTYDEDSHTLHVVDLKYGKHIKVSAYKNRQIMLYAHGVIINNRDIQLDIEKVVLHVYQPRMNNIDSYEIDVQYLVDWVDGKVKPAVARVVDKDLTYNPSEKACFFCKHAGNCQALSDYATPSETYKKGDMPLEVAYETVRNQKLITSHLNKAKALVEERMLKGEEVDGLKLVMAQGNRYFNEQGLRRLVRRLGKKEAYQDPKPLTLAKATALLGEAFVDDNTSRFESSLKVVLDSDKRDAYIIGDQDDGMESSFGNLDK